MKRAAVLIISIHAPLAGCDLRRSEQRRRDVNFNPRTPRGVRLGRRGSSGSRSLFQSTHPSRGATVLRPRRAYMMGISIHAPLAGCDTAPPAGGGIRAKFQSTHPSRGATLHFTDKRIGIQISIHAPLAGCDSPWILKHTKNVNFNPRTPRGVRRLSRIAIKRSSKFQSTHPSRGATCPPQRGGHPCKISIHAPLAGCDQFTIQPRARGGHFNPRTPRGVRQERPKE